MKRAAVLGVAAAVYTLAAWSARPGFYDGLQAPQYAYVSPPPALAPGNVAPTSGSGTLTGAGGFVATHDQPIGQAGIAVPRGGLPGPTRFEITPYAPPTATGATTLTGNVYCISATNDLVAGTRVTVTLLTPVAQPFPSDMYFATTRDAHAWTSLGGRADMTTYLWPADTTQLGCFALGYVTPGHPPGLTIGGPLLPVITALLIVIVVFAGLPAMLRRRSRPRG